MNSITVYLTLISVLAIGQVSSVPKEIEAEYHNLTGTPLPLNASSVEMQKPANLPIGNGGYTIISFTLSASSFNTIMDEPHPGFGPWQPFSELRVGTRLFSSNDMRNSMLSKKRNGDIISALLLDFDHNQVFALSYSN